MKIGDFRQKSIDDLRMELKNLFQKKFNLRMQCVTDKPPKSHLLRKVRRNIALIKTLITEKKGIL